MKNVHEEFVGYIQLGDTVDVTDPCYDAEGWCRKTIPNMAPGQYACYAVISDEGKWGERVSRARIVLDDGSIPAQNTKAKVKRGRSWRYADYIGVDAGLAGFFANKPDFGDKQWEELCDWITAQGQKAYIKKMPNGTDGFWTDSGYGDGCYNVYAIHEMVGRNNSRVTALEIRFL